MIHQSTSPLSGAKSDEHHKYEELGIFETWWFWPILGGILMLYLMISLLACYCCRRRRQTNYIMVGQRSRYGAVDGMLESCREAHPVNSYTENVHSAPVCLPAYSYPHQGRAVNVGYTSVPYASPLNPQAYTYPHQSPPVYSYYAQPPFETKQ